MKQSITLKSLTSFVAAVLLAFPASVSAAETKDHPADESNFQRKSDDPDYSDRL